MERDSLRGVKGWLLVYLLGTVPPMVIYAMGLSGWFFDYPVVLMAAIFLALAVPLWLVAVKSPGAPRWNIAMLWVVVVLMTLRSLAVVLMPSGDWDPMSREEMLGVLPVLCTIVAFSLAWAIAWTLYFKGSQRVANTFS